MKFTRGYDTGELYQCRTFKYYDKYKNLNLKRLCLQKLKIKSCRVLDKFIKLSLYCKFANANRIHNASQWQVSLKKVMDDFSNVLLLLFLFLF